MWVQTLEGREVSFLDPDIKEISFSDIAVGLAYAYHFGGHTFKKITVAEHSIWVSQFAEKIAKSMNRDERFVNDCALWGLIHDAHEAYTGDIPGPIKRLLDENYGPANLIREIEDRLNRVIAHKVMNLADIPEDVKVLVKKVDQRVVYSEHIYFQGEEPREWSFRPEPFDRDEFEIRTLTPDEAERQWRVRLAMLRQER